MSWAEIQPPTAAADQGSSRATCQHFSWHADLLTQDEGKPGPKAGLSFLIILVSAVETGIFGLVCVNFKFQGIFAEVERVSQQLEGERG